SSCSSPPMSRSNTGRVYRIAGDVVSTRGQAPSRRRLEREQVVTETLVVAQLLRRSAEADRALLEHVDTLAECQGELDVLLGQQDGQALVLEARDLLA